MDDLILHILESIKNKMISIGYTDDHNLTLSAIEFFDVNIRTDSVSSMLQSYDDSISLVGKR